MKLFKSLKRPVTLALAAIMAISLIPAASVSAKTKYKTVKDGGKKYIVFGSYEQDGDETNGKEPIEWEVLGKDKNGILVVSRYALDCQPYNKKGSDGTWKNCTLRKWLNKQFYKTAFNANEQKKINTVNVKNADNPYYDTKGGDNTKDKLFCLSVDEIMAHYSCDRYFDSKYYGYYQSLILLPTAYAKKRGVATTTIEEANYKLFYIDYGYTSDCVGIESCYWWLRTPGRNGDYVCRVIYEGIAGAGTDNVVDMDFFGVRPAMYLKK